MIIHSTITLSKITAHPFEDSSFNPSMYKLSHAQLSVGRNYLSIPNFNGRTVAVSEWMSSFILHFIIDVITYPCWDQS